MSHRLLLTSGGLTNDLLVNSLQKMIGKPFEEAAVCFVPTASVAEGGHHDWFVEDLNRIYSLGWKQFDILDFNGQPSSITLGRLSTSDVIYVEGGDTYALARSIHDNNLAEGLLELLETKVYVGVSAGSMIFSQDFTSRLIALYGDQAASFQNNQRRHISPLNLFDWFIKPHANFNSEERLSIEFPCYVIDDETAVQVLGKAVTVISKGRWHLEE